MPHNAMKSQNPDQMIQDPLKIMVKAGDGLAYVGESLENLASAGRTAFQLMPVISYAPSKTVRQYNHTADGVVETLTISQTTSSENKPLKTVRSLIRFDFVKNDVEGKPVVLSAYAVFSLPQGGPFTEDQIGSYTGRLATFMGVNIDVPFGQVDGINVATTGSTLLKRILNGES